MGKGVGNRGQISTEICNSGGGKCYDQAYEYGEERVFKYRGNQENIKKEAIEYTPKRCEGVNQVIIWG